MKFELVSDSAADLSKEETSQKNITVVPFYVSLDGKTYLKEDADISVLDFYKSMAQNSSYFPKTSMPSVQDYMDAFLPLVQKNMPVLCICLTKKFSGSMQSALTAKLTLEDEYPEARIHVMDSQLVTALQGLFVQEAVRLRDADLSLEETVSRLEAIRSTGRIFFTTKDLKYLQHGGRIGKAACVMGSVLNLKPVLSFSEGELGPAEICRGRKKSLQKIIINFYNYIKEKNIDLQEYLFATGIGLGLEEYEEFQKELGVMFEKIGSHPYSVQRMQIGATIGVHTGPYPMGLGILKRCTL